MDFGLYLVWEEIMDKKDNKSLKILGFFLILCLTGFMGYTAIVGFGDKKIGSAYNVKQGLDLFIRKERIVLRLKFRAYPMRMRF